MKKLLILVILTIFFGLMKANAKLIVDVLPNPTTTSSSYGMIQLTGSATSIIYHIPSGYNNKNGYFHLKNDQKTATGSFLANTGIVDGGVLKRLQFFINNDVKATFEIFGFKAPANSSSDFINGESLGNIKVTASGEYSFDFTEEYQYFALYIKTSTSTQIKDIKITWDDNSNVKEDYVPTWEGLTVYEGYTTTIPLGLTFPSNITFSSANPAIASVDAAGVVTGNQLGTTQITASWKEDEYFSASGSPFTVNVNVEERPLEREWHILKYSQNVAGGQPVDVDAVCEGDPGTWHAYHPKCYISGLQLGSTTNPFNQGTLSLSGSNLPESAYIKRIEIDVTGNTTKSSSTWNASVNGIEVEGELKFSGSELQTFAFENVYIPGNLIVLKATTAKDPLRVSRIYVKYDEYTCATPFTEITPEATVIPLGDEQFKVIIPNTGDDVEFFYMLTPNATSSLTSTEYQRASREDNGACSVLVSGYGNLKYYGYHQASDSRGMIKHIEINDQTGIEEIATSSRPSIFYNLQGIKIPEWALLPGIYLCRQGNNFVKVIIKK